MQMLTFVFQVHTRKGAVINDGHDSQEQDKWKRARFDLQPLHQAVNSGSRTLAGQMNLVFCVMYPRHSNDCVSFPKNEL